mgnify:CR=1 FL=1
MKHIALCYDRLDFLDFLENRSLVSLQYLENGRFRQEIKKRIRKGPGTESWPENGRYWQMQKGKYACQKPAKIESCRICNT